MPLPPDLNSYAEPPRGDYVQYVERLLAWSDGQRQRAQGKAAVAAPAVVQAPLGPRPAALPGARGRAASAGQAIPPAVAPAGRQPRWRSWPMAHIWRVVMAVAWLGLGALFFLAPALLPVALVLAVALGWYRGVAKKPRP